VRHQPLCSVRTQAEPCERGGAQQPVVITSDDVPQLIT
jgi:hypothetical protein